MNVENILKWNFKILEKFCFFSAGHKRLQKDSFMHANLPRAFV